MMRIKFLEYLVSKHYDNIDEIWMKDDKVILLGDNTFYEGYFLDNKLFIQKRALRPCTDTYALKSISL